MIMWLNKQYFSFSESSSVALSTTVQKLPKGKTMGSHLTGVNIAVTLTIINFQTSLRRKTR